MAFSYSALSSLIAEDGRDELIDQIDNSTTLVDWKMSDPNKKNKAKVWETMRLPDQVGRLQIDNAGYPNQGFSVDGGTRRAAVQSTFNSGTYGFAILDGSIDFPEGITRVMDGRGGVDLFTSAMDKAGKQMSRLSERALLNNEFAAVTTGCAISGTSIVVDDTSGFRPGVIFDSYAADGTTLKQSNVAVTSVTQAAAQDGSGTIGLTAATVTVAIAATDRLFVAGSGGAASPTAGTRCVNVADVMNSAIAIYSGLAAGDQPAGTVDSTSLAWSNSAGERMMMNIYNTCGEAPTHLVAHPFQRQKIFESQNPNLRYTTGDTLDNYGPRLAFDKAQVVICPTQKPKRIDFINGSGLASKLHVFWEPGPVVDGGKSGGWSKESLQLSQTTAAWRLFLSMGINLRVPRRNAHGSMTALSAAP